MKETYRDPLDRIAAAERGPRPSVWSRIGVWVWVAVLAFAALSPLFFPPGTIVPLP
jgi:hypothetical protein